MGGKTGVPMGDTYAWIGQGIDEAEVSDAQWRDYDFSVGEARELDFTHAATLELGKCFGCGFNAYLPVGAPLPLRLCMSCWRAVRSNGHIIAADPLPRHKEYPKQMCKGRCGRTVNKRKCTPGYCRNCAWKRRKRRSRVNGKSHLD